MTYKYDESAESNSVNPITLITPTITITPTPEEIPSIPDEKEEKYPAWRVLPYYGEGFVVDRYIAPLTLAVKPKGLDKKLVEEEVKKWLEENKFEGEHKIQWE